MADSSQHLSTGVWLQILVFRNMINIRNSNCDTITKITCQNCLIIVYCLSFSIAHNKDGSEGCNAHRPMGIPGKSDIDLKIRYTYSVHFKVSTTISSHFALPIL